MKILYKLGIVALVLFNLNTLLRLESEQVSVPTWQIVAILAAVFAGFVYGIWKICQESKPPKSK